MTICGRISTASVVTITIGCGTAPPGPLATAPAPASAAPPASTLLSPLPPPFAEPAPPPEPASPFRVVTEYEHEAVLHGLGDRAFVSVEQALYEIDGELINADESLVAGLSEPGLWRIARVVGKWPDPAWLEIVQAYGASGRSILFRRRGKRWQLERVIPGAKMFVGIAPWTGDRLLGLVQSNFVFDGSFRLIDATRPAALPQFTRPKKSVSFCVNRVHAEAFTALSSGHVFVGGVVCETTGDDAAAVGAGIERWEPGQTRGTIDMLPGMDVGPRYDALTVDFLVAVSPTEVYVTAERVRRVDGSPRAAQLFRFDGTGWRSLSAAIPNGVSGLWLGREGILWAADGVGHPYKRASDGTWLRLPLPPDLRAGRTTSVWQAADGSVWAVIELRDRWFVVHTPVAGSSAPR